VSGGESGAVLSIARGGISGSLRQVVTRPPRNARLSLCLFPRMGPTLPVRLRIAPPSQLRRFHRASVRPSSPVGVPGSSPMSPTEETLVRFRSKCAEGDVERPQYRSRSLSVPDSSGVGSVPGVERPKFPPRLRDGESSDAKMGSSRGWVTRRDDSKPRMKRRKQ